ncbi:hypothetical protein FJM67_05735 [Maribrevibacterium harenarium]|uniref:Uncharacterized protein n=1 Tax=Maribrevibacterium harenarium TaxID=2589817 RepID=A0A501WZ21_9GAMM|nr:hypothetical protein [Maribrevibacterium harenarium]TPE54112.1 hypothetical protein FJM67_05735 [Maribrevibacterium harenarium]
MSVGIYEEPLPCGGKLKVNKESWEISYYFSGPDSRYNGTFVSVPGESVERYISAFIDNWEDYKKLQESIPKGGDFSTVGKMGMSIRLGNFAEGVCIQSYHMPISSEQDLKKVISGYRYASQRALQIQQFLVSL